MRGRSVSPLWVSNLDDKKSGEFPEQLGVFLRGAVADQLRFILEDKVRAADNTSRNFTSPSWAAQTAYSMGRADVCRELLSLIEIKRN